MLRTSMFTCIALLAFAGNSVLCRLALKDGTIDPGGFSFIRLFSGALFLAVLVMFKRSKGATYNIGSWAGAVFLFVYVLTFSYAYVSLETGTGALILFGFVQLTMLAIGALKGYRFSFFELLGLMLAVLGLAYLLLPGATAPPLSGFMLMALSGVAWGLYTYTGMGSSTPLEDTTGNFVRSLVFVIPVFLYVQNDLLLTQRGIILAVVSGTLTSGVGYAIWYSALRGLKVTQAAVLQLLVPIIAAFGGLIFSSEYITLELMIGSALVLGGVLVVILTKSRKSLLQSA